MQAVRSVPCFAQSDRPDTETQRFSEPNHSGEFPVIRYSLSFGMVHQVAPDAFPELSRIIRLLEPPNADLERAELVCRAALKNRPSEECKMVLAAILSDLDRHDEALELLTSVIDRDRSNWQALLVRSQVRSRLRDFKGARRDSEAAAALVQDVVFDDWDDALIEESLFDLAEIDLFDFDVRAPRESATLAALVACFAVGCFVLCLRWGLRQKREANGTRWQLIGVSAYVTAIWTVPVAVAATMTGCDIGQPPGIVWWAFMGLFAVLFIRGTMKPPNLTYVGKEALPECDSPQMLARIQQLSQRIGVATPTVRMQRAIEHPSDSSAAFVGGLAPHSIVLYDTILSQLREDEQDGIIGHELGHVANHSIWVYSAIYPLTMTAMIVLSFLGGSFFGVMAGAALRAGAFRLMSRRFEFDCDRRAALATSPDAVARGLRRIYARHLLGKSGLLTDIVHSTATHPSLNERIHAMDVLASPTRSEAGSLLSVSYDNSRVTRCRKLVAAFAILWFCLTAYGIAATLLMGDSFWPIVALFAAVFGPTFFIMLASRRAVKIAKARMKGRLRWSNLTLRRKLGVSSISVLCTAGGLLIIAFHFDFLPNTFPIATGVAITSYGQLISGLLIVLFGGAAFAMLCGPIEKQSNKKPKLAQTITAAIQRNDFDEVIEICKENYDVVKHDRQLKYSGAAALLATRQLEKFIPYAEQIREEFPHFPPPAISLATAYLDQGEPEKALDRIRGIEKNLHKADPLPAIMSSRALLALGRLDEAKAECDRGLELAPDDVSSMAQAARVAMAAEELDESDRLIQQGSDLLPAEPLLIVARGERAILNNDQAALQTERDALAAALQGDRLLCLYNSLAQFNTALGAFSADEV